MKTYKRLLLIIVSLILVVSALVFPTVASAGPVEQYRDQLVAGGSDTELQLGNLVTITVPEGALPEGTLLIAQLKVVGEDQFVLRLSPEQDFDESVTVNLVGFPGIEAVESFSRSESEVIPVVDGVFQVDHCSRYSGYY